MNKPERFAVLTLNLQADSVAELRHRLREIEGDLGEGGAEESRNISQGGCTAGFWLTLKINPTQTTERYHDELTEFLRASKQGEATPDNSYEGPI